MYFVRQSIRDNKPVSKKCYPSGTCIEKGISSKIPLDEHKYTLGSFDMTG